MYLNPFGFLFDSQVNPHIKVPRKNFQQKIQNTFNVFASNSDFESNSFRAGVFDYLTAGLFFVFYLILFKIINSIQTERDSRQFDGNFINTFLREYQIYHYIDFIGVPLQLSIEIIAAVSLLPRYVFSFICTAFALPIIGAIHLGFFVFSDEDDEDKTENNIVPSANDRSSDSLHESSLMQSKNLLPEAKHDAILTQKRDDMAQPLVKDTLRDASSHAAAQHNKNNLLKVQLGSDASKTNKKEGDVKDTVAEKKFTKSEVVSKTTPSFDRYVPSTTKETSQNASVHQHSTKFFREPTSTYAPPVNNTATSAPALNTQSSLMSDPRVAVLLKSAQKMKLEEEKETRFQQKPQRNAPQKNNQPRGQREPIKRAEQHKPPEQDQAKQRLQQHQAQQERRVEQHRQQQRQRLERDRQRQRWLLEQHQQAKRARLAQETVDQETYSH